MLVSLGQALPTERIWTHCRRPDCIERSSGKVERWGRMNLASLGLELITVWKNRLPSIGRSSYSNNINDSSAIRRIEKNPHQRC